MKNCFKPSISCFCLHCMIVVKQDFKILQEGHQDLNIDTHPSHSMFIGLVLICPGNLILNSMKYFGI